MVGTNPREIKDRLPNYLFCKKRTTNIFIIVTQVYMRGYNDAVYSICPHSLSTTSVTQKARNMLFHSSLCTCLKVINTWMRSSVCTVLQLAFPGDSSLSWNKAREAGRPKIDEVDFTDFLHFFPVWDMLPISCIWLFGPNSFGNTS